MTCKGVTYFTLPLKFAITVLPESFCGENISEGNFHSFTLLQVCHYWHAFSCFLPISFFFISKSLTEPCRAGEMKEHVNNE